MYQGKQIAPTLDLKPTAANLKHAQRVRAEVIAEVKAGIFSFAKHFPDYRHREAYQPSNGPDARTFGKWYELWTALAARELEHSTLTIYKRHMKAYWLPAFEHMMPERITHEAILARLTALATDREGDDTGEEVAGLSRKTQNNIMIPLRAVFDLICRPPSTLANPCNGIENLKVQKAEPDPFTAEEVEIILANMRERSGPEWPVWHDYYEFFLFAGLRPSEQVALLWDDVDLRTNTIAVRRTRVLTKDKNRTKTNMRRTVELNDRAAAALQRQRARTQAMGTALGGHVFYNPNTGRAFADDQAQGNAWRLVLRSCKVRYRAPKECRDTSVTMALMAGADPVWVAAQHGHSVVVMMRDYARWIPNADRGRNRAAVNLALAPPKPPAENAA